MRSKRSDDPITLFVGQVRQGCDQGWRFARERVRRLPVPGLFRFRRNGFAKPAPATGKNHPAYQVALDNTKKFTPKPGCDYEWTVAYGKDCYAGLEASFRYLDEKADSIIKYLGGGSAVITVGALAAPGVAGSWLPYLFLPSLCCALLAIRAAAEIRQPNWVPGAPPVKVAVEYAEAYGDKAEATFVALWHACCEGVAVANDDKAKKLRGATRWYVRALAWLLLPVVVWPIWCKLSPAPKPLTQVEMISHKE
jgi:hypothetical protein